MLIQRAGTGTIPPPGFCPPPWDSLAASWNSAPVPSRTTVTLGPATISIGHDDFESEDTRPDKTHQIDGHEYGWDNENPKRSYDVDAFEIEWRVVTNGEFYEFYKGEGKGKVRLPASWVEQGENILVRDIATVTSSRYYVFSQVRTLYGPVPVDIARHWPIWTTYDDLSTYAGAKGGRIPTEQELRLFYDKFITGYEDGANVGFRNWHPVP